MVIYSAEDEQEPTVKKSSNEQLPPQDDKEHPLLGMKEEAQSFFDLQMESKNLTIEKKVEEVVFMAGPCKGYELSYVALCGTKYLKWVLKMSHLEKKTKDLIKQALAKTLSFLTFCISHQPISPTTKTTEAYLYSATNPTAFPRKLKIAPTTLPTIAGNASAVFHASLLSASASLSNHFFRVPLNFDGEPPVIPTPLILPVTSSKSICNGEDNR